MRSYYPARNQLFIGFLLIWTLTYFQACKNDKIRPKVSFYYWRTIFKLSEAENEALLHNNVTKLYVRYFDIELNDKNEAIPLSPIIFSKKPEKTELVPVVYIKNEVWINGTNDPENLAEKVVKYIDQINNKTQINNNELQIDCDWTLKSRDKFMKFIQSLKRISGKTITTTIRLHQIKYQKKTGIPDVQTATLMYYNMGTISADSKNSIYEKEIANRYIKSIYNYPLPLKIALPIFSWAIQIRDRKVINLCNKLDFKEIAKDTNFVYLNSNFWRVKHSNIKSGYYYKADDTLKLELIKSTDLMEIANQLKRELKYPPTEIIFYDLDDFNLQQYDKKIFQEVCNNF